MAASSPTDRGAQTEPVVEHEYSGLPGLKGRRVIVLGTGDGLGGDISRALHQAGATVVCVDRDSASAQATADAVEGYAIVCDVTQEESLTEMMAEAQHEVGPINGLVDVVASAKMGSLASLDYEDWERTMRGVVGHAFLSLTVGADAIASSGGGSMVFIGSNSGLAAIKGQAAYGAAKAALHHLVMCMGPELAARGVRVNAVAPSFIKNPSLGRRLTATEWRLVSERIPVGQPARPADITGPTLFLMSAFASHVTGQVLVVDGGLTRVMQLPSLPWNRDV